MELFAFDSAFSALINTDYTPSGLMSNQVLLLTDQIEGNVGIKPLQVVSGNTYQQGNICQPENGDLHLVIVHPFVYNGETLFVLVPQGQTSFLCAVTLIIIFS